MVDEIQEGMTVENQQLIASLSAKNQALLEMNRELEAKRAPPCSLPLSISATAPRGGR